MRSDKRELEAGSSKLLVYQLAEDALLNYWHRRH